MRSAGTRSRSAFHQQRTIQPLRDGISAVCIGYMLCKKYGVDTQNFAINRIPDSLKEMEPKGVRAELSKTRNAMSEVHSRISEVQYKQKQARSKDYER